MKLYLFKKWKINRFSFKLFIKYLKNILKLINHTILDFKVNLKTKKQKTFDLVRLFSILFYLLNKKKTNFKKDKIVNFRTF